MIANAVDLAKNQQAVLHAAAIEITIPPITNPWSSLLIDTGKMVEEAERTSHLHGQRLLNILANRCETAGVTLRRETIAADQLACGEVVSQIARHYDIVLLDAAPRFQAITEEVIFGSGRPAILYPDGLFTGRIDHVAIAWDGSRAAARALGDAALFIAGASQVSVIYALDEKPIEQDVGRRLFDVLESRGVKAEAYAINTYKQPIGDVLQLQATDLRADLLVMGAFGHSRLREFVLGGATRDVLGEVRLPLLISH
jgi:nucleotide-binding universal stress UspA family protein